MIIKDNAYVLNYYNKNNSIEGKMESIGTSIIYYYKYYKLLTCLSIYRPLLEHYFLLFRE